MQVFNKYLLAIITQVARNSVPLLTWLVAAQICLLFDARRKKDCGDICYIRGAVIRGAERWCSREEMPVPQSRPAILPTKPLFFSCRQQRFNLNIMIASMQLKTTEIIKSLVKPLNMYIV